MLCCVVLRCVVLCCVVLCCVVLRCVVLCCVVLRCACVALLTVNDLVNAMHIYLILLL